jgi:hypothetical protein
MLAISLAILATPTAQDDHWQQIANPNLLAYYPIELHPNHTQLKGYGFTITARPDGRLPLLQALPIFDNYVTIAKKLPNGNYALFAKLHGTVYHAPEDGGLLLTPGDYAVVEFNFSHPWANMAGGVLFSGKWVSGEEQNLIWNVTATSWPPSHPITGGGTVQGYRFDVEARPDGKVARFDWHTSYVNQPGSKLEIYRLNPNGKTFDTWVKISDLRRSSRLPILLKPGTYMIHAPQDLNPDRMSQNYANVLSGRWVDP